MARKGLLCICGLLAAGGVVLVGTSSDLSLAATESYRMGGLLLLGGGLLGVQQFGSHRAG